MNSEEIRDYFASTTEAHPEKSQAIAAIETLIEFIKKDQSETIHGLLESLKLCMKVVKDASSSSTSVQSGCELFVRFITLLARSLLEDKDFQKSKQVMVERGMTYLKRVELSRGKIAQLCKPFIRDGTTLLIHSFSRVVLETLKLAAQSQIRFTVYVTESRPDDSGKTMVESLEAANIPCTLILDAAVGYIMERVDIVLVGAEGIVESGGIINKIGSYSVALAAHASNKPFYVLSESFKFVRLYPLKQEDTPNIHTYDMTTGDRQTSHPVVDYTPPAYITLLFTDLGILTPSAVSDQLISLYV